MGIRNLFNEKLENTLVMSASMVTKQWSIDLMKKYGYIVKSLVKSIIGIPVAVVLVPMALIGLPIINLVTNLLSSLATFIFSPLIAAGLTVWHAGKDFIRKDKIETLYNEKLARADEITWDKYVTSAIREYDAFSPESKKLKEELTNTNKDFRDRKVTFCRFFGLANHKDSYAEYNAGKDITNCILSNAAETSQQEEGVSNSR